MVTRGKASATKQREAGVKTGNRGAGIPKSNKPSLPMLRTSERGTLHRCEFQWWLTYERRLRAGVDAPALRFGSLVHGALAQYYIPGLKRGKHPAESFKKLYAADMKVNQEKFGAKVGEDEKWVDALELGVAMLENYVDEYGDDTKWEVLVTEHPFKTLVYHPMSYDPNYPPEAQDGAQPWFWYTGVVDGVWRHTGSGEIWVPDHKTAASLSDSKLSYLQMDDQAGSYWSWGVDYLYDKGILKPDQKLAGMVYNFLAKKLPDERPFNLVHGRRQYLNKDGSISKKQPTPHFLRIPIYRDEYDRNMAKHRAQVDMSRLEMLRDGRLEVSKSPGQWTCPMCPVRDVCELHETGNDFEGFISATTHTWDPYAEHEVYLGR